MKIVNQRTTAPAPDPDACAYDGPTGDPDATPTLFVYDDLGTDRPRVIAAYATITCCGPCADDAAREVIADTDGARDLDMVDLR